MSKYQEMIANAPMTLKVTGKIRSVSEAQTYGRLCAVQGWDVANIHETVEPGIQAIALASYQAKLNRINAQSNRAF